MTSTSQSAASPNARTIPAHAMRTRVPQSLQPGSVHAGNAYRIFGGVDRDVNHGAGVRYSSGVSGLSGLGTAQTHNAITSGVASGLSIAAIYDPEPISKMILAIGAALTGFISQFFAGCGQTCTQATKVVDQVEAQYLKPLLDQWHSLPVHYYSNQQQALAVFDAAWAMVLKGCGDPNLGEAGRKCISERQRGGTSAWCPNCNWFTLYRDPIANDPSVIPDPTMEQIAAASGLPASTSGYAVNGTTDSNSLNNPFGITPLDMNMTSNISGVPVWLIALGAIGVLLVSSGGGK